MNYSFSEKPVPYILRAVVFDGAVATNELFLSCVFGMFNAIYFKMVMM